MTYACIWSIQVPILKVACIYEWSAVCQLMPRLLLANGFLLPSWLGDTRWPVANISICTQLCFRYDPHEDVGQYHLPVAQCWNTFYFYVSKSHGKLGQIDPLNRRPIFHDYLVSKVYDWEDQVTLIVPECNSNLHGGKHSYWPLIARRIWLKCFVLLISLAAGHNCNGQRQIIALITARNMWQDTSRKQHNSPTMMRYRISFVNILKKKLSWNIYCTLYSMLIQKPMLSW